MSGLSARGKRNCNTVAYGERFYELTRRVAIRALGSAGCQPAILAGAIVMISDPGPGKLPRPTGWQPVLPRIKESKAARESVKSEIASRFNE